VNHLLSVDDLQDRDVDIVLRRAADLHAAASPQRSDRFMAAAFFEESLRTRVGFAAAASRLGWATVPVDAPRAGPSSTAESWNDTLHTLAGLVDVVVARPGIALERSTVDRIAEAVVINGGDRGHLAEHPSQALIDLFAIERLHGPADALTVAFCGDLRMRSARSLRKLLERRGSKIVAITSDELAAPDAGHVERREPWQLADVGVLYVIGIPHQALPLNVRQRLLVDDEAMRSLPHDAVVLSPMPVIDEITPAARADDRVRFFETNALSVAVRVALLEAVTAGAEAQGPSSKQASSSARPGTLR
jgi:aspartate carbamoyltransferase catalytic subunit